ncbi:hypothetical protein [Salinicola halophilus]|uniref:hypothetical protein n=1 Tax=Salinicola halophilus TaxID=184065 RepID=UPI000DA259CC|nr:hypothetical protein [Salinicola halophilus]
MPVKLVARQLLESCDPAKRQYPSATDTRTYRALSRQEQRRVDRLVARARRVMGLRAHRRLPAILRPFIAMRWGCFNAFGPELAPLAWMTGAYVRGVPSPGSRYPSLAGATTAGK